MKYYVRIPVIGFVRVPRWLHDCWRGDRYGMSRP